MKNSRIDSAIKNNKMDCSKFIESIRKRMDSVPGLIIDNFGLSAHLGKKLSAGCKACKKNKWIVVFIGKACNCKCYFCPQTHNKPRIGSKIDRDGIVETNILPSAAYYDHLLIKLKNAAAIKTIEALGYGGGETFLYLDRIKKYAKELTAIQSGLYQYAYTNGIAVTEDSVKELREAGIREIRFNLAATNYSEEIIDKMGLIRKIIPFLTIEVPSLRDTRLKIKEHIRRFIDIGVDQINLSELYINRYNAQYFNNEKYYDVNVFHLSDIKKGRVISDTLIERYTVWSRHVTYDIIEMAAKEKWPITINDCSVLNHCKPIILAI